MNSLRLMFFLWLNYTMPIENQIYLISSYLFIVALSDRQTDRYFIDRKKVNPDLFVIEIEICTCIYNIENHHGMPIIISYIDSIMPYPKMDSVVTALIILYSDNIMLYAYMSYHSIIMVL